VISGGWGFTFRIVISKGGTEMDLARMIGIAIAFIIPTFVFAGLLYSWFHTWAVVYLWWIVMAIIYVSLIRGKLDGLFKKKTA
jgi:hypothetical protein